MEPKSCYTVDDVAEILSVSGNTVRRLLREGKLKGGKMGDGESAKAPWRIQHEDLDSFMKERGMSGLKANPSRPEPKQMSA
jgi:excisionase family DNA binding protein